MITYPAETSVRAPIPKTIRAALLKIVALAKDKAVEKDEENLHGGYKYASVDAVYEIAGAILAEAGLGILFTERSCAYDQEGKRIRYVFEWTLFTETEEWTSEHSTRTIILPYTGPQSSQAAQSYAEKALLKHLLKLRTGDAEPEDAGEPGVDLKAAKAKAAKEAKPPVDSMAQATLVKSILGDLEVRHPKGNSPMNAQETEAFAEKWGADIATLDEKSKGVIRTALKERKT